MGNLFLLLCSPQALTGDLTVDMDQIGTDCALAEVRYCCSNADNSPLASDAVLPDVLLKVNPQESWLLSAHTNIRTQAESSPRVCNLLLQTRTDSATTHPMNLITSRTVDAGRATGDTKEGQGVKDSSGAWHWRGLTC
ncbi:hypothetical protein B0T09DRAFT_334986 [Sordaria sp. MPI-SDFR-AT-0083]|nr:hypothetical protein B0T09DRAFT_334986 [Sordaria sp. MPI-SDFR-AT-0083]